MLKLVAVGDISLGDQPVCYGHGVRSMIDKYGISSIFEHVHEDLNGDVVFGNLEYVLSDIGCDDAILTKGEFRGRPEYASGLRSAGFTTVSVANNHSMQYGCDAFNDTINILENSNITPVGVGTEAGSNSHSLTHEDTKLQILAYSLRPENYHTGQPQYAHHDTAQLIQQVKDIKKDGTIVVVSLHWGDEYLNTPSPNQVVLARSIIDAGASLIIGHHPHVLQGIEHYRDGYIVYSLGNFVADFWQDYAKRSAILKCEISNNGIERIVLEPIYINKLYQPVVAQDRLRKSILDDIDEFSNALKNINIYETNDLDKDYRKLANKAYKKYRIESYIYFAMNIYKYKASILAQSIKRFLMRRFE